MVKRWINRKEVKELFRVSDTRLKQMSVLNLVETKNEVKKSGQRGRPLKLYNTAQLKGFFAHSKIEQKALLSPSSEKKMKAWSAIIETAVGFPTVVEEEVVEDTVNHPPYYNTGSIEVIDAIDDWGLDFSAGNVVKYIVRAAHKDNQQEDLEKAMWYIQRLLG